jgi:hypothetical protein
MYLLPTAYEVVKGKGLASDAMEDLSLSNVSFTKYARTNCLINTFFGVVKLFLVYQVIIFLITSYLN